MEDTFRMLLRRRFALCQLFRTRTQKAKNKALTMGHDSAYFTPEADF